MLYLPRLITVETETISAAVTTTTGLGRLRAVHLAVTTRSQRTIKVNMDEYIPLDATVEARLTAATRATLGTVTLAMANLAAAKASSVTRRATLGTITLGVSSLSTAEASAVASAAAGLAAEVGGTEAVVGRTEAIIETASRSPAVGVRGAPAVVSSASVGGLEAGLRTEASCVTTEAVKAVAVDLGLVLDELTGLSSAMLLGIFMSVPILRI
jgi:hypothetical protein